MMAQPDIQQYPVKEHYEISVKMIRQLIEQGKKEGFIDRNLPVPLIMSVFELYRRDITSKDSILLANHNIASIQDKFFEKIMFYGFSGKR